MVKNSSASIINASTAVFNDIDKILTNYDDSGGSSVITMAQLRTQIASVFSYEDPDFLFHFSAVARCAIALDARANRPLFKLSKNLPSDDDPQIMPPVVLSDQVPPPPTADLYGPVEGFLTRPVPVPPSRFEDLSMFPSTYSTNSFGPPPPPSPPGSSTHRTIQGSHGELSSSVSPRAPEPGPSLLKRIHFSQDSLPRVSHLKNLGDVPFEGLDKGKRRRISFSPSSSRYEFQPPTASTTTHNLRNDPSAPFDTSRFFPSTPMSAPYMEDNEHLVPEDFTPVSFEVNQIALLYKSNIKQHISCFNSCKNRPANWQNSLTKDLLEYNFVDLRKFYGAVASSDPPQSRLRINADGDLKNVEGASPKEITDNNHWQNLLAVLKHAYIAAFPPAAISIKKYFDHILRLPGLFQARVHWEDVRDYDVELRKEFASRPSLVWGDYAHDSLKGIDNRILYSSTSKLGRAAVPTQRYPSTSRSSKYFDDSPSSSKNSKSTSAKKQKGKRNKPPYKIKDSRSLPKADQPCNNWNLGVCPHADDTCERVHGICNKDGCTEHHQGSVAHK